MFSVPTACVQWTVLWKILLLSSRERERYSIEHRLEKYSRDRLAKYCVFLKILTNVPFQFFGGIWAKYLTLQFCFSSLFEKVDLEKRVADVYKSFRLLIKNLINRNITTTSLLYAHEQCRRLKRSTKDPLFGEDDCTLPIYLYLLYSMV